MNPKIKSIFDWATDLATKNNVGTGWADHSIYVADLAKSIATHANMDAEFAYDAGLLHDIGRCHPGSYGKGTPPVIHSISGYRKLMDEDLPRHAKICLTHNLYSGEYVEELTEGLSPEDKEFYKNFIQNTQFDDYDKLIALADSLAVKEGYVTLEQRTIDIMFRYGYRESWIEGFKPKYRLKKYFDQKCGKSVYDLLPNFMASSLNFNYECLN